MGCAPPCFPQPSAALSAAGAGQGGAQEGGRMEKDPGEGEGSLAQGLGRGKPRCNCVPVIWGGFQPFPRFMIDVCSEASRRLAIFIHSAQKIRGSSAGWATPPAPHSPPAPSLSCSCKPGLLLPTPCYPRALKGSSDFATLSSFWLRYILHLTTLGLADVSSCLAGIQKAVTPPHLQLGIRWDRLTHRAL